MNLINIFTQLWNCSALAIAEPPRESYGDDDSDSVTGSMLSLHRPGKMRSLIVRKPAGFSLFGSASQYLTFFSQVPRRTITGRAKQLRQLLRPHLRPMRMRLHPLQLHPLHRLRTLPIPDAHDIGREE